MSDLTPPRHFASDAAIRDIGARFLAQRLPKVDWTHEAHLATCLWLLRERPDIDVDVEIAGLISGYNASVGVVNDDRQGYHDTITRAYVAGVRLWLATAQRLPLVEQVNGLLDSPMGQRDWPLRFWSSDRLFSVAARRGWLAPDIVPLPVVTKTV